ncbi:hypothetical protein ACJA88_014565 [Fusarium oxysporum]
MSQQLIEETPHVSGQSNTPMTEPVHVLTFEQVAEQLQCHTVDGLRTAATSSASSRVSSPSRSSSMLILAMAASFGIQSWIEGGVIAAVIMLNIVVGFFQEFQAANTMDSLRSLSSPTAHAVRDGNNQVIVTAEIVPGDLVELETGDTIPADIRLIKAVNVETNEALLTGESPPVRKETASTFPDDTGPGDGLNVAYSSSTVTKGRALVSASLLFSRRREPKRREDGTASTGRWMQAWTLTFSDAVGRFLGVNVGISLYRKLSKLALLLLGTAIACAIIVPGYNEFNPKREVIIYAVATGVSMIAASLIVVLTITMAAGTKRMVQRNVIVRNLRSLEALDGVTSMSRRGVPSRVEPGIIIVRKAWIPARGTFSVGATSEPFNPTQGQLDLQDAQPKDIDFQLSDAEGTPINPEKVVARDPTLQEYVASLANLATVHQVQGEWHGRGDPTEIAIQVFASRFNWNRLRLATGEKPQWHEVAEFSFNSDVKKMSVIFEHDQSQKQWVFTKGAVERVLSSCPRYAVGDEIKHLTPDVKQAILRNMEASARLGLRVLALGSRTDIRHADLVFRGLIGLYDPTRPESAPSVRQRHEAGVSVHTLTGDHLETARAIALEVGILSTKMSQIPVNIAKTIEMAALNFGKPSDDEIY